MTVNRRDFFRGVLAAVTVGATFNVTKAALADPVLGRYAMVVKLQQRMYEARDRFRETTMVRYEHPSSTPINPHFPWKCRDGVTVEMRRKAQQPVLDRADDLLKYLMDNFAARQSDETCMLINDLFEGCFNYIDTMSVEDLKTLVDEVLVIAVIKRAISKERVPFDTNRMRYFDDFACTYKDLILAGPRRSEEDRVYLYPEWAKRRYSEQQIANLLERRNKMSRANV